MSVSLTALATLTGLFVLYLWSRKVKTPAPLPPGPKGIPILGNISTLPLRERWLAVTKLAKEFGDLLHLRVLGQDVVFLNTSEASVDLLERRGAIYSDRFQYVMAGELCGFGDAILCVSLGDQFKRQRKLMDRAIGHSSIRNLYEPMIEAETRLFLHRLMEGRSSANYRINVRQYIGGLILSIVYGHQVHSDDDEFLFEAQNGSDILGNHLFAGSGIWPVDVFPFLKHIPSWFPGASFKRNAIVWKEALRRSVDKPYQFVKEKMREGSALPSFCSTLLGEDELDEQKEHDIKFSATSMFLGSTDTTIAFVGHLILALVLYPEVVTKAHKEIDAVVGNGRWPTFRDRSHLPYIDAVLSECMRWSVPVPLNLPHKLQEDNVYRNMYIPKGTLVIANTWAISRNELLYPNPDMFNPERFMELDEKTARQRDPRNFVFGFGRRRCPGIHLTESSLWSLTVSMLAAFDFSKAIDDEGNVIEPDIEYPDAFVRMLKPFKFNIKPRGDHLKLHA